jgi:hypothetical protein
MGSHINAGPELLLEAGARHERTLEAVSPSPWLGVVFAAQNGNVDASESTPVFACS